MTGEGHLAGARDDGERRARAASGTAVVLAILVFALATLALGYRYWFRFHGPGKQAPAAIEGLTPEGPAAMLARLGALGPEAAAKERERLFGGRVRWTGLVLDTGPTSAGAGLRIQHADQERVTVVLDPSTSYDLPSLRNRRVVVDGRLERLEPGGVRLVDGKVVQVLPPG